MLSPPKYNYQPNFLPATQLGKHYFLKCDYWWTVFPCSWKEASFRSLIEYRRIPGEPCGHSSSSWKFCGRFPLPLAASLWPQPLPFISPLWPEGELQLPLVSPDFCPVMGLGVGEGCGVSVLQRCQERRAW